MPIKPSPFFDPSITAPQSELSLSILSRALVDTYPERQGKIDSIRVEIEMLLDYLMNLVKAESHYHSRMGIFQDRNASDPLGSSTAPEVRVDTRSALIKSFKPVDAVNEVKESPSHPSSVPPVTVGIIKTIKMLDDVDRDIRLYSHRVKATRLQIHCKLLALEMLLDEAAKTKKDSGVGNG